MKVGDVVKFTDEHLREFRVRRTHKCVELLITEIISYGSFRADIIVNSLTDSLRPDGLFVSKAFEVKTPPPSIEDFL